MRGLLAFLFGGAAVIAASSMAKKKTMPKMASGGGVDDEMFWKEVQDEYEEKYVPIDLEKEITLPNGMTALWLEDNNGKVRIWKIGYGDLASKESWQNMTESEILDGAVKRYERLRKEKGFAKGGGIQKVWYKREGKKDYYYDKDAIWYQNYGVYKKGDDGFDYSTKEQIIKIYKKKNGMDMINSFRKNRDYKVIDEKFYDGVLYYIAFLDLSDGTMSNTISFSIGDLYAKGGAVESFSLSDYKENEEINNHSENALMLVKKYGTQDEIDAVQRLISKGKREGGFSMEDYREIYELSGKYYKHLVAESKGNKLAKGGAVEDFKDVATSTIISPLDINNFISYCNEFYGKNGIYAKEVNGGFSATEIKKAVLEYLDKLGKTPTWGGGDSMDRERVREILQPSYKFAKGGAVGNSIAIKYGKMLNDLNKEKSFNKKIELNSAINKFAKQNEISIDGNNIISIKGNKVAYIDKINAKTGQPKANWDIKQY